MAEGLIAKGAEAHEGIFRLPGNIRKVKDMEQALNDGQDPVTGADLNDLASLFKSWFGSLPEALITDDQLPKLKTAYETKEYVEFVQAIPRAHSITLKYLIGFLKRMTPCEAATKMSAKNYAICFAPNIVSSGSITNQSMLAQYAEISQEFLVHLIGHWDTSDIYPPPPALLEG
jgi:hypothetical protein